MDEVEGGWCVGKDTLLVFILEHGHTRCNSIKSLCYCVSNLGDLCLDLHCPSITCLHFLATNFNFDPSAANAVFIFQEAWTDHVQEFAINVDDCVLIFTVADVLEEGRELAANAWLEVELWHIMQDVS